MSGGLAFSYYESIGWQFGLYGSHGTGGQINIYPVKINPSVEVTITPEAQTIYDLGGGSVDVSGSAGVGYDVSIGGSFNVNEGKIDVFDQPSATFSFGVSNPEAGVQVVYSNTYTYTAISLGGQTPTIPSDYVDAPFRLKKGSPYIPTIPNDYDVIQ